MRKFNRRHVNRRRIHVVALGVALLTAVTTLPSGATGQTSGISAAAKTELLNYANRFAASHGDSAPADIEAATTQHGKACRLLRGHKCAKPLGAAVWVLAMRGHFRSAHSSEGTTESPNLVESPTVVVLELRATRPVSRQVSITWSNSYPNLEPIGPVVHLGSATTPTKPTEPSGSGFSTAVKKELLDYANRFAASHGDSAPSDIEAATTQHGKACRLLRGHECGEPLGMAVWVLAMHGHFRSAHSSEGTKESPNLVESPTVVVLELRATRPVSRQVSITWSNSYPNLEPIGPVVDLGSTTTSPTTTTGSATGTTTGITTGTTTGTATATTGTATTGTTAGGMMGKTKEEVKKEELEKAKSAKQNLLGPSEVAAGASIFKDQCAVCHGAGGEGASGDNYASYYGLKRAQTVEGVIIQLIEPDLGMPNVGETMKFAEKEDVADYICVKLVMKCEEAH